MAIRAGQGKVTLLAVDPGLSGGYAVFTVIMGSPRLTQAGRLPTVIVEENRKKKTKLDMPAFIALVAEIAPTATVIERVTAMPGNGAVSMFNFGVVYGQLIACLYTKNSVPDFVQPKSWQTALLGKSRGKVQKTDIRKAIVGMIAEGRVSSSVQLSARFPRVEDDGVYDAVGIGLYWLKQHGYDN